MKRSVPRANNTDENDQTLLRPCCIVECDRYGTRLLSSLRENYVLKDGHSGRVCEGHYRRDLRAFKRKRNSDTPKTITEATQQFPAFKQMDTTQQISNDPLDLSPSTTYSSEEYPISPSSPISSDYSNSYVPPVTMNELMLKPEVFMEVNEELEEGLEEGPSIIRITPTNRVKRLPDLHLPVSDYRKFKTFCEFVLKAERVL